MSTAIQQDFFIKEDKDLYRLEVLNLQTEVSNLRRGMFSRHGELYKSIAVMQETIDKLKNEIQELKNVDKNFQKAV